MIGHLYKTLFIPSSEMTTNSKSHITQYIFLLNCALDPTMQNDDELMAVSEICRDKNYAIALSENGSKQNILFCGIKREKIALGVCEWIKFCLFNDKNDSSQMVMPLLLSLFAECASRHVFLRPSIANFACLLIANGDSDQSDLQSFDAKTCSFSSMKRMELLKAMLDLLLFIVQIGEYVVVFEAINEAKWSGLDLSLHRHFIHQIIKTIHDPMPKQFVCLLFKMIADNEQILVAIRNDQETARMVAKFVEGHKEMSPVDAHNILTQIDDR